jgi:signal peptidase I
MSSVELSTAHALKCELVEEVLSQSGFVCVRVTGYSMLPSIWPGDTLLIQRRSLQQARKGNILVFLRSKRLVAHRLISAAESVEKSSFIAQGDALPSADYPVSPSKVLGIVTRIIRRGKNISPSSRLKSYQRLVGILAWRSNVIARILICVQSIYSMARCGEEG